MDLGIYGFCNLFWSVVLPCKRLANCYMNLSLWTSQTFDHADKVFIFLLLLLTFVVFLGYLFPTLIDVVRVELIADGYRNDVALPDKFREGYAFLLLG